MSDLPEPKPGAFRAALIGLIIALVVFVAVAVAMSLMKDRTADEPPGGSSGGAGAFVDVEPLWPDAEFRGDAVQLEPQTVAPGGVTLTVALALPDGFKINDAGPMAVVVRSESSNVLSAAKRLAKPPFPVAVPVVARAGEGRLIVDLDIYYCAKGNEAQCYTKQARITVPVKVVQGAETVALRVEYAVPAPAAVAF